MSSNKNNWKVEDSDHLYQVSRWGEGYFAINNKGELVVTPEKNEHQISLNAIIEEAQKDRLSLPFVIRFHDVLRSQVVKLNRTFQKVMEQAKYQGDYFGVYPIKVNQLREVVEEIVDAGSEFNYGLEAGSKTELLTVLAQNTNEKSLTILNGYKDKEYLELALLGTKIGRNMVVVIEKYSEILNLLEVVEGEEQCPMIGVRVKLNSKSSGKWAESSGDFAKFGLTVSELVDFIDLLKRENKLQYLKLFHFHAGSQIPDIKTIKECITEGARFYTELIKLGAPLEYFDAGGGVGINYESSAYSINYNLDNYIEDVVYIIRDICDEKKIKHPSIVTETGRAIAAQHSCVVTNVFGSAKPKPPKMENIERNPDDHLLLKKMKDCYLELNFSNYLDVYNDACLYKEETLSAFKLGVLDLRQRVVIENLYWNVCQQILTMTENTEDVHPEIEQLRTNMADKLLCNFSLFQSAPDSWAIGQVLPVVPITRLDERPTHECTLADITCDSDGKISEFSGPDGLKKTMPIHKFEYGEDYNIGLFLTGAYQDTMGDMHNLFGRLNEVHVYIDKDDPKGFYIEEVIFGNSAAQVLEIMQYSPFEMARKIKSTVDKKIKEGKIKPREGIKLVDYFENSLKGYTYLE